MQIPEGAVTDSFDITFKYRKNGNMIEFDKNHFPPDFDSTYEYLDRYDKLVRKGNAEPAIIDFSIKTLNGTDTTTTLLNQDCVLLMLKDFDTPVRLWQNDVLRINDLCKKKQLHFYIVTAMPEKMSEIFSPAHITILKADATVIKTAVRVQPAYVLLQKATIVGKHSFVDIERVEADINKLHP